jgi:hypothetical protein
VKSATHNRFGGTRRTVAAPGRPGAPRRRPAPRYAPVGPGPHRAGQAGPVSRSTVHTRAMCPASSSSRRCRDDAGRVRKARTVPAAIGQPCSDSTRQIGSTPNRGCSSMNLTSVAVAGRARPRKSRRCLEDLVGAAQLGTLPPQPLQVGGLRRRVTRSTGPNDFADPLGAHRPTPATDLIHAQLCSWAERVNSVLKTTFRRSDDSACAHRRSKRWSPPLSRYSTTNIAAPHDPLWKPTYRYREWLTEQLRLVASRMGKEALF